MPTASQPVRSTQFPIAVIMGHQEGQAMRWASLRREPLAVVAGAHLANKNSLTTPILSHNDGKEQLLCTGFTQRLHRDEAESYYFNLRGEQPRLFVICNEDESGQLTPCFVTSSYDKATAYMEVEEEYVFALPIPPEVYRWIEQFVLEHYRPSRKKKRNRENWKTQAMKKHTHKA